MTIFIYQEENGQQREFKMSLFYPVRIGSDRTGNEIVFPADWKVAPRHAVIQRSTLFGQPVLLESDNYPVYVNGEPVLLMRILRQGDKIQIGRAELSVVEMHISIIETGSRLIDAECPFCTGKLKVGDAIITCPRCGLAHHQACWMEQKLCSRYGCGYPVQNAIMDALREKVNFEALIGAMHPLVKKQKSCLAEQPRDRVPFQVQQVVAYCPQCGEAFHLECWLVIADCPRCGHNPQKLIRELLAKSV
jgi:Zn finger protein HypA/HybF involved in hydrogenase expression